MPKEIKQEEKSIPVIYVDSAETVSPGHPDKVMDAIAESIFDEYQKGDKDTRFALDGVGKNDKIFLAGEITSKAHVNKPTVVRQVLEEIGYTSDVYPDSNCENVHIIEEFTEQSPDIKQGVDKKDKESSEGAGDQGIVVGFAINEAPDFTAHKQYLARKISYEIFNKKFPWARPDQKTQVSVKYVNDKPVAVTDVVQAISHQPNTPIEIITNDVKQVVDKILADYEKETGITHEGYKLHVNSTGKFEVCSFVGDSGEVGRKIVVDQYQGSAPVGGGNLNGKDFTKVDRTGVYMARYVAKKAVASGLCDKLTILIGYVIGEADPVSIAIDTHGTEKVAKSKIADFVNSFSFRPTDMIEFLKLKQPISKRGFACKNLGMYGHIGQPFGDYTLPWESID